VGKILVMDDFLILRLIARDFLHAMGHEVKIVTSGEEALQSYEAAKMQGRPFDAVILDLYISEGMGGPETMARLLEIDPDVKAIVSSGCMEDPLVTDFESHGFRAVLPKPFTIEDLKQSLRAAGACLAVPK
jgi:two-component system cell cycle sensor histidine kinase/response regulator CckA